MNTQPTEQLETIDLSIQVPSEISKSWLAHFLAKAIDELADNYANYDNGECSVRRQAALHRIGDSLDDMIKQLRENTEESTVYIFPR